MILFFAALFFLVLAGPSDAGPVVGAIAMAAKAVAAWKIGGFAVGAFLLRTAASFALSALARAKMQRKNQATGGIRTDATMSGEGTSATIVFGKYATAGCMVCPPMTDDVASKVVNAYLTYVIDLSDAPITSLDGVWIDDTRIQIGAPDGQGRFGDHHRALGDYAGKAWFKFFDGTQTQAYQRLIDTVEPARPWQGDMIGRGVAYVVMRFKFDRELYQGLPNCLFEVTGIRLYDPRKDSSVGGSGPHRWGQSATYEPSENPAVQVYNILRGIELPDGSRWGGECEAEDLPLSNWFAAMNHADELVDGKPRYRASYEVAIGPEELGGDEPAEIIEQVLRGCSGDISEFGGVYKIRLGGPGLPVMAFTDDDLLISEAQTLRPFVGLESSHNAVHAQYPEPLERWAAKEAPPRYFAEYEAADQGRRLVASLQLPATPYPDQVQRVMLAYIQDDRRGRFHDLPMPGDFAVLEPLDSVAWSSEANGYSAKVFEVTGRGDNLITLDQQMALRERDPSDYDWSPDFRLPTSVGQPTTPLPAPRSVLNFNAEPFVVRDAGGVARRPAIRLYWNPEQDDAQGIQYRVRLEGKTELAGRGSISGIETGEHIVSEGILPEANYEVSARLTTARSTVWTGWIKVKAPSAFITAEDIDEAIIEEMSETARKAGITPVEGLPASGEPNQIVMLVPDGILYRWDPEANGGAGAWTEKLYAGIPDGAIDETKLAQSLNVPKIVDALPATGRPGQLVTLSTDQKLYRWDGSGWTTDEFSLTPGLVKEVHIDAQAVTAAKIANDAVSAAKLGEAAVTRDKILSGAVDTLKLADLAITEAKVALGAISGGRIADGAVAAGKIADSAITAIKLANGAVTRDKILDGAISELKIANGAITDAKISGMAASKVTGQLTDSQIAGVAAAKLAGQLSTAQLANGAITAAKLGPLAVEASKLANNAVTETKINDGAITTPKLVAGAVVADKIAAGAITASKMVLGDFSNLVPDNQFQDPSNWDANSDMPSGLWGVYPSASASWGEGAAGAIWSNYLTSTSGYTTLALSKTRIPLIAGREYYYRYTMRRYNSGTGRGRMAVWYYKADGSLNGSAGLSGMATDSATPIVAQGTFVSPAGTVEAIVGFQYDRSYSSGVIFRSAEIREKNAGSLIVDGAITASLVAANAITAGKIDTGAVTADTIAANAITAAKVSAGAIETAKLAAGAVEAGKIAAGAILTVKLAANAVTAVKITAGAIETEKLAASAVIADTIAANAVTAVKVSAGAIETAKLAAGAVEAGKIAAGAVVAGKLAANAVTADTIAAGAITAAKISAGAIGADQISAGAIVASKLAVADFTNLVPDGDLQDPDAWQLEPGWSLRPITGTASTTVESTGDLHWTQGAHAYATAKNAIPVIAGQEYFASFQTARLTAGAIRVWADVEWLDKNGDKLSHSSIFPVPALIDTGGITKASAVVIPPSGTFFVRWRFAVNNETTATSLAFWAPTLRLRNTGQLIVDGAITANKIETNAVTADKIIANAITTAKIAALAVTASEIAANAVTADKIIANAITTAKINAGAVTATEIASNAVTADKIISNAITSAKILAGAVTANELSSNSVTTVKIATNAVTANEIAANTIVAGNITSSAITADKIAANAITAAKISAGAIGADQIAAGAIVASKLAISDYTNMVPDSEFQDVAGWWGIPNDGSGILQLRPLSAFGAVKTEGDVVYWNARNTQNANADFRSGYIPVTVGDKLHVGGQMIRSAGTKKRAFFGLIWYNKNKEGIGYPQTYSINGTTSTSAYQWSEMTVPEGVFFARWRGFVYGADTDSDVVFASPTIRLMNKGELIVDGAISANKIATDAVTANKIAASAVTASAIATGAIVAGSGKIANAAITNALIANLTITNAKIANGTITTAEIANAAITSAKIDDAAINSAKIANLAVGTLKVANNAISTYERSYTAAIIQTPSNSNTVVQTLSLDVGRNGPVCLDVAFDYANPADGYTVQLRRIKDGNTTIIYNAPYTVQQFMARIVDTESLSGAVTYQLRIIHDSSAPRAVSNRFIGVLNVLK